MIKLIALDMDGTLLNEEQKLTQAQVEAIHAAIQKGVKIVLCTGRPLSGVKPYVRQLGFDQEEEYIIINNGCSTHSTKDWGLLDWEEVTPDGIRYLSTFVQDDEIQLTLFDEADYFFLGETANPEIQHDAGLVFVTPVPLTLEQATNGQKRYFEAMFVGNKAALDHFQTNHEAALSKDYTVVRSQQTILEMLPNGASKATGLKKLADRLGIDASQVMALGDADNDLEMIEWAGLGIAMGNANEAVKAIAQDITDSNNHDGVAKAIEKYILK